MGSDHLQQGVEFQGFPGIGIEIQISCFHGVFPAAARLISHPPNSVKPLI
jgi:hypothetical protein